MFETKTEQVSERVILVGLVLPSTPYTEVKETLSELALLADTAGAIILDQLLQHRGTIDSTYFIGRGMAETLALKAKEMDVQAIIFDEDLSPAQTRNLENLIEVKIIDRSRLILDIFAGRAKSREAQTQVELAQLSYMLPRLPRQWTHLSRQAGGGGASGGIGIRGPGETQLEVDRRATRNRISVLKRALNRISRQRTVSRKRGTNAFRVALVGYTNAGKSTLMNALSGANVRVENQLFATLDSTTRKVSLGYNRQILLTDTVGFIKKLPHHLIASFQSTLEETTQADLLLHVVDVGHPCCSEQIATVFDVLNELEIANKPLLMVFNKIDCLQDKNLQRSLATDYPEAIWISAKTGAGLKDLTFTIFSRLEGDRIVLKLQIPQSKGKLLSELYRLGEILSIEYENNEVLFEIKISRQNAHRLLPNGQHQFVS